MDVFTKLGKVFSITGIVQLGTHQAALPKILVMIRSNIVFASFLGDLNRPKSRFNIAKPSTAWDHY